MNRTDESSAPRSSNRCIRGCEPSERRRCEMSCLRAAALRVN